MPNKDKNIPKRRFKAFENADAWELRPLGEIGNTYTGLSGKTKDDFGHGDGRFVTYMNVFSNPISLPEMVEAVEIDERQNTVRYGDVLFTTSSETPEEVGMSSVWLENTENTYLNSFCFGFRPVKKVNPYYLAYLLRSSGMRRKISFLAQGISRYNISKTKMMELEISIPNENEQSAIGTFFSTLDQQITLHQRKLDKLKNVKQAYLSEMFPAEGERVPKRRFPGFTDDWELRKLGNTDTIFTDGNYGEAYPKDSDLTTSSNGVPFLRGSNIQDGKLNLDNANYITISKHNELTSGHLEEDDIVIAVRGSLGSVGYVEEDNIGWNINSQLAIIRTNKDEITGRYLIQILLSDSGKKMINSLVTGTALKQLPIKNLKKIQFSIPTLPEQKAIATFFSTLDRQITLHQRKLEKLKNLKKALLNELFV